MAMNGRKNLKLLRNVPEKKQFFNICNIVLRDMQLCITAGKAPGARASRQVRRRRT